MINIAKIEKERERQNISMAEMAERLGISRQAYYDIIKRKATKLSTLEKIAGVLDFEYKDLLI